MPWSFQADGEDLFSGAEMDVVLASVRRWRACWFKRVDSAVSREVLPVQAAIIHLCCSLEFSYLPNENIFRDNWGTFVWLKRLVLHAENYKVLHNAIENHFISKWFHIEPLKFHKRFIVVRKRWYFKHPKMVLLWYLCW